MLYSAHSAAKSLGVSINTVIYMIESGIMKAREDVHGRRVWFVITEAEVERIRGVYADRRSKVWRDNTEVAY